jgi:hypothetical protein
MPVRPQQRHSDAASCCEASAVLMLHADNTGQERAIFSSVSLRCVYSLLIGAAANLHQARSFRAAFDSHYSRFHACIEHRVHCA